MESTFNVTKNTCTSEIRSQLHSPGDGLPDVTLEHFVMCVLLLRPKTQISTLAPVPETGITYLGPAVSEMLPARTITRFFSDGILKCKLNLALSRGHFLSPASAHIISCFGSDQLLRCKQDMISEEFQTA